jgi:hypothetical protein
MNRSDPDPDLIDYSIFTVLLAVLFVIFVLILVFDGNLFNLNDLNGH